MATCSDGWGVDSPDSLFNTCIEYCIKHPDIYCMKDKSGFYNLKDGISLPTQVSQALMNAYSAVWFEPDETFLNIFNDTYSTHLLFINVTNTNVSGTRLQHLLKHKPLELHISGYERLDMPNVVSYINKYGSNLQRLHLGDIMKYGAISVDFKPLDCPRLRVLSLHNLRETDFFDALQFITRLTSHCQKLQYLDLMSASFQIEHFDGLHQFTNLVSLNLCDVPIVDLDRLLKYVTKLKFLNALDLSQSRHHPVIYENPEKYIRELVDNLPRLQILDISGTNLAGEEESVSHAPSKNLNRSVEETPCSIRGLEGRQLEFLGLLGCAHNACQREHIPAKQVTGTATEKQVLLSIKRYVERPEMLMKGLNELFQILRFSTCEDQQSALMYILAAMKRHPGDKHVQISGSIFLSGCFFSVKSTKSMVKQRVTAQWANKYACREEICASLFYIVKGSEKEKLTFRLRKRVIEALITGMDMHTSEQTMMRNGFLTLCHFQIPQDMLFVYKRLVRLILEVVSNQEQDEFVTRIGVYLLNSLACQVDGYEKRLVGELGAINRMLDIIKFKLSQLQCDEVMEIAWSAMWNVTDETPSNCQTFIDNSGLKLFLDCLKNFPHSDELLRNMMGLLGNVAEVPFLRPKLMDPAFVSVFGDLLASTSDGIEVSYNACGVLAHMVSDGPVAWTINFPPREDILAAMVKAIRRWKLKTKRNINYRSFEPILRLLPKYDAPEAQHWAVWALCNLTKMYKKRYCELLVKEHGLEKLRELLADPRPYDEMRDLAQQVIRRCESFTSDEAYSSGDEDEIVDVVMEEM